MEVLLLLLAVVVVRLLAATVTLLGRTAGRLYGAVVGPRRRREGKSAGETASPSLGTGAPHHGGEAERRPAQPHDRGVDNAQHLLRPWATLPIGGPGSGG
jgi:hypothetical protein